MTIGELVRHFLTEQIGIILDSAYSPSSGASYQVLWTTRGISLFGPGSKEWCGESGLEVLK